MPGWSAIRHASACSSGTAAIHAAVAALDPEPGDEIVTTPITDMGALAPILYQGAIPVFADVDPRTGNVTADTIADRLSDRTKAIVVTHLFGNPCEMARDHGSGGQAQAAGDRGLRPGVSRRVRRSHSSARSARSAASASSRESTSRLARAAWSSPTTTTLARRVRLFIDKAWGYGDPTPDHYFLALNYRMSELQGAVALAQLGKLEASVKRRREMAARLTSALDGLPGVETPWVHPDNRHVFWRYCSESIPRSFQAGPAALAAALKDYDIASAPRYIQKPAFRCAGVRASSAPSASSR